MIKVTLLTKSFRSLPEKHKGLVEIRYRQRYVDLITNPKVATFSSSAANHLPSAPSLRNAAL